MGLVNISTIRCVESFPFDMAQVLTLFNIGLFPPYISLQTLHSTLLVQNGCFQVNFSIHHMLILDKDAWESKNVDTYVADFCD